MRKYIIIMLSLILFLMGIIFITNDELKAYNESFVSGQCPTTMIKNGEQIMVYNPILYLEKVFDTQGQELYEIKPSFDTDIPIGSMNHSMPRVTREPKILDASRDDPPYNQNSLPGIDNQNQMIGIGNDKMILYPNSQNIEPSNYLRRK